MWLYILGFSISVSKDIRPTIIHAKDCMHAWSILHTRFGGSVRPRLYSLRIEVNTLGKTELSVPEYHDRLIHLWTEKELLESYEACNRVGSVIFALFTLEEGY